VQGMGVQAPLVHVVPAPQILPHRPQFAGSATTEMQLLPHNACPLAHAGS